MHISSNRLLCKFLTFDWPLLGHFYARHFHEGGWCTQLNIFIKSHCKPVCNSLYFTYEQMDFWKIVLSQTLQETDFETEFSRRKFSGESEAVRWQDLAEEAKLQWRSKEDLSKLWSMKDPSEMSQTRQGGKFSVSPYPPVTKHRMTKERGAQPWARQLPLGEGNLSKSKTHPKGMWLRHDSVH